MAAAAAADRPKTDDVMDIILKIYMGDPEKELTEKSIMEVLSKMGITQHSSEEEISAVFDDFFQQTSGSSGAVQKLIETRSGELILPLIGCSYPMKTETETKIVALLCEVDPTTRDLFGMDLLDSGIGRRISTKYIPQFSENIKHIISVQHKPRTRLSEKKDAKWIKMSQDIADIYKAGAFTEKEAEKAADDLLAELERSGVFHTEPAMSRARMA